MNLAPNIMYTRKRGAERIVENSVAVASDQQEDIQKDFGAFRKRLDCCKSMRSSLLFRFALFAFA